MVLGSKEPSRQLKWGSVLNFANATIGVGILGVPLTFYWMGWLLGLLSLIFGLVLNVYSGLLLQHLAEKQYSSRSGRFSGDKATLSYESLAKSKLGTAGFLLVGISIIGRGIGILVIYLLVIADFLEEVLRVFVDNDPFYSLSARILLLIPFVGIFIFPLTLVKRMDSLKLVSLLGLLAVGYFLLAICVDLGLSGVFRVIAIDRLLFRVNLDFFRGFAIQSLAYSSTVNVIPIWIEDTTQSPHFVTVGQTIVFALYAVVGSLGLYQWGEGVQSNFLILYLRKEVPWLVSMPTLYCFSLATTYALVNYVVRSSFYEILRHARHEGDSAKLLNRERVYLLVGVAILLASTTLVVFYGELEVIFTLTGSIFTSLVALVIPGWMGVRDPRGSEGQKVGSWFLIIFGTVIGGIAFGYQLFLEFQ